jgi:hypothetical protein
MDLKAYFEDTDGLGILSTADTQGNVDSAIYATPHVMGADTIAFIMRPRLSFENVQQNPKAVYMYVEKGPGYQGRRFYLEKSGQEDDQEKVNQLRRSSHGHGGDEADARLVYFKVTHVRPLVGDKDQA